MGEPLSFGETSSTAVPTKVCNSGTRTRGPRYSPCAVLSVPASTKRFRCCDGRNKPFPIFIMSGAQPEEPLYEDEFVSIAHDAIVIKAYYFPFGLENHPCRRHRVGARCGSPGRGGHPGVQGLGHGLQQHLVGVRLEAPQQAARNEGPDLLRGRLQEPGLVQAR